MQIILSADDLGRSLERNKAVEKAFCQGLIKSAAIMIATPYTEDGVRRMSDCDGGKWLSQIHLHFNLAGGVVGDDSVPSSERFASCNAFCENGCFRDYFDRNKYNYSSLKYAGLVLEELQAQYDKFKMLTLGRANYKHVDFHLWQNLFLPVSKAFGEFTSRNGISSVRYIGQHHLHNLNARKYLAHNLMAQALSYRCSVKRYKSCNIDYFLTNIERFKNDEIIELYCHPDIIEGKLYDNSVSYFGHPKVQLEEHVQKIDDVVGGCEFISWSDII